MFWCIKTLSKVLLVLFHRKSIKKKARLPISQFQKPFLSALPYWSVLNPTYFIHWQISIKTNIYMPILKSWITCFTNFSKKFTHFFIVSRQAYIIWPEVSKTLKSGCFAMVQRQTHTRTLPLYEWVCPRADAAKIMIWAFYRKENSYYQQ